MTTDGILRDRVCVCVYVVYVRVVLVCMFGLLLSIGDRRRGGIVGWGMEPKRS